MSSSARMLARRPQESRSPAATEPKAAPGRPAGTPLFLSHRTGTPIQPKLEVSEPGDAWEREADQVATTVMRMPEPSAGCGPSCHCSACKAKRGPGEDDELALTVHRKAAGAESGASTADVASTIASGGEPLHQGARSFFEPRFGRDFGDVRIHVGGPAEESARGLGASAYTVGSHIVFGRGRYAPGTTDGRHLLAHELAHVVQQGAGDTIRRAPDPSGAGGPQRTAGPCAILAEELTNEDLLFQLNRARVYLTQNKRGEGDWYDYANLLRRLSAERRRRIREGHLWLGEPGLLHVPPVLYALSPTGPLEISVEQVAGAVAAGLPTAAAGTFVAPEQLDRFLAQRGIPVVNAADHFGRQDPARRDPLRLALRPELRTVQQPMLIDFAPDPMEQLLHPFGQAGSPFGWGEPSDSWRTSIPLGSSGLVQRPLYPGRPLSSTYLVTANHVMDDLVRSPGGITTSGSERVYLPAPAAAPVTPLPTANPFLFPAGPSDDFPVAGMGTLGYFGQPDVPLPSNSTGILWEGSHTSDFVVLNGRIYPRGFRASMLTHGRSDFERKLMTGGGKTTARLNVGTPGTYANDALFPFFKSAVAIYRKDGTPVQAQDLMRLMAAAGAGMDGQEYRYSSPTADSRTGQAALDKARAEAARRGMPNWCPAGARSCVNLPMPVHDVALGGHHMVIPGKDGTMIDLADPFAATAKNMDRFVELPDSFFEERGLVRVRIGPRMRGGVGMSGLLGAGTALAGDALMSPDGTSPYYVRDATIGFTSSAVGHVTESYVSNFAANRLVGAGMAPGSSATAGRLVGGTGVAVVLAPAVTGISMLFDDEEYTRIDYAARMGRSAVGAGGGALAAGAYFALLGSEVPIAGNIVGFLIGVGGYYLTDSLLGETTEEAIREGMGEYGCTEGIGPGR